MIKKLIIISSLAILLTGCGKSSSVINMPEMPVSGPSVDNSYDDFLKIEEEANTSKSLILARPNTKPVKKKQA